ncbi:MAG: hypothetical protein AB4352_27380 [Hormoscilla sp.]
MKRLMRFRRAIASRLETGFLLQTLASGAKIIAETRFIGLRVLWAIGGRA